ncbi:MAG TPA: prepilin-type N-terminal cleavage/methylation domain-containing protein, partial [Gemmatimonadota bacterium]|nr:prepilin-type N-terminal cleavage/methylation domain-containing protein [Gemmatimonadota bacterium]
MSAPVGPGARPAAAGSPRPGGFTLVELLVALLIGTLIVLAIHRGVATAWHLESSAQAESRRSQRALEVLEQFTDWLAAVPPPGSSASGPSRVMWTPPSLPSDRALGFLTLSPSPWESRLTRVEIRVLREPGAPDTVPSALVSILQPVATPNRPDTLVLWRGVRSMAVQYLGRTPDAGTSGQVLPRA